MAKVLVSKSGLCCRALSLHLTMVLFSDLQKLSINLLVWSACPPDSSSFALAIVAVVLCTAEYFCADFWVLAFL